VTNKAAKKITEETFSAASDSVKEKAEDSLVKSSNTDIKNIESKSDKLSQ